VTLAALTVAVFAVVFDRRLVWAATAVGSFHI